MAKKKNEQTTSTRPAATSPDDDRWETDYVAAEDWRMKKIGILCSRFKSLDCIGDTGSEDIFATMRPDLWCIFEPTLRISNGRVASDAICVYVETYRDNTLAAEVFLCGVAAGDNYWVGRGVLTDADVRAARYKDYVAADDETPCVYDAEIATVDKVMQGCELLEHA